MAYVYIRSEPGLFTVGFYDPSGKWHAESDHETEGAAAARVRWLNGGPDDGVLRAAENLLAAAKAGTPVLRDQGVRSTAFAASADQMAAAWRDLAEAVAKARGRKGG